MSKALEFLPRVKKLRYGHFVVSVFILQIQINASSTGSCIQYQYNKYELIYQVL